MNVIRHDSAEALLAKAQSFLERDEAVNGLILGNCLRIRRHPERTETPPLLVTAEDGSSLQLAAMMMPPNKILLAAQQPCSLSALESLVRALLDWQVAVPGVFAADELAASFAKRWSEVTGQVASSGGMHQRLCSLTSVKEAPAVAGRLRPAMDVDIDLLGEWIRGFVHDVFGAEISAEEGQKRSAARVEDGDLYVWENGDPVSMAAKARPTTHGVCVNHVYTPPEVRGQGYATACVAQLSQLLLDEGRHFCCLFADLANPTSNGIYQRIGYEPVCDFSEYAFGAEA